MTRREPTPTTVKVLWSRAAGRCAICKKELTRDATNGDLFTIGKNAHICAAESGGPRYDASLSDDQLRSYSNLILVCAIHHDEIDGDETKYTVTVLRELKDSHVKWVQEQLLEAIPQVGYPELEVIIKYLETISVSESGEDYSLTEIKSKIEKNELTPATERLVQMGLTQAPTIASYLNDFPDPQYSERLRQFFVAKYDELRASGLSGDDLFYEIAEAVKGTHTEIPRMAAAVALVTYFFERCDIFEK